MSSYIKQDNGKLVHFKNVFYFNKVLKLLNQIFVAYLNNIIKILYNLFQNIVIKMLN